MTSSTQPSVSVIIRNRNESHHLKHALHALSLQDVNDIEVIVVDNESTDGSVELARDFGAKVLLLSQSSFSYGRALNLGLREAAAEICVILSAHSLPLGFGFIRECLRPFKHERVAAARCVYAGKGADVLRWMEPEVLDGDGDYISKGPLASGCVIRRKVWQEVPFDEEAEAAEEKLWTSEVLKRGYVVHSPCNAFYAYLKEFSPDESMKKNYREVKQVYLSTGQRVGFINRSIKETLVDLARGVLIGVPVSALRVARFELKKAYLRLSFARQAGRGLASKVF
jgi:glycosyltransferase involved in cell wall biosynthesis